MDRERSFLVPHKLLEPILEKLGRQNRGEEEVGLRAVDFEHTDDYTRPIDRIPDSEEIILFTRIPPVS